MAAEGGAQIATATVTAETDALVTTRGKRGSAGARTLCRSFPLLLLLGMVLCAGALAVRRSSREAPPPLTLSLWLMVPPPGGAEHAGGKTVDARRVQAEIERLARAGGGPTFPPHATVVGAFAARSREDADAMATRLRAGLRGFGAVDCRLGEILAEPAWNQALAVALEPSPAFLDLCRASRALLGMEAEGWEFPPPAGVPHVSLYYGEPPDVPDAGGVDPGLPGGSFRATTLELWVTSPPTLVGVPEWRALADISLV